MDDACDFAERCEALDSHLVMRLVTPSAALPIADGAIMCRPRLVGTEPHIQTASLAAHFTTHPRNFQTAIVDRTHRESRLSELYMSGRRQRR